MFPWIQRMTDQSGLQSVLSLNGDYPDLTIDISLEYFLSCLKGVRVIFVFETKEHRLRGVSLGSTSEKIGEDLQSRLQVFVQPNPDEQVRIVAQVFGVTDKDVEQFALKLHLEEQRASGWRVWLKR